jgi:integrase
MYKHGDIWVSDFWCNGDRYKKSWGAISKTVAKEKERKFRTDILEGKQPPKSKRVLFETFAEKYLELAGMYKKSSSIKRNRVSLNRLGSYFEGVLLSSIGPWTLEQFKSNRKKEGRAAGTINRDIDCIKNMMKRAVEWGYLFRDPLRDVKRLREKSERIWALTPGEEMKLLEACEKSAQRGTKKDKIFAKYLKDLVLVALKTGMREREIFNLKKEDIHLPERYMILRDTKTGDPRTVPINDSLCELLARRLKDPRSEYLFCTSKGTRLTVLTKAFWTAVKDAGLVRIDAKTGKSIRFRLHDCRHTFGTRLGMERVDLKTIMEIMGHKTTKVAMMYQHPMSSHKLEAVKTLDQLPPKVPPAGKEDRKVVNITGRIGIE